VQIQTPYSSIFQVTVMNSFGQLITTHLMNNGTTLDINGLDSGQYILKIEQDNVTDYLKLMVIR
jgi:hypothetical protein